MTSILYACRQTFGSYFALNFRKIAFFFSCYGNKQKNNRGVACFTVDRGDGKEFDKKLWVWNHSYLWAANPYQNWTFCIFLFRIDGQVYFWQTDESTKNSLNQTQAKIILKRKKNLSLFFQVINLPSGKGTGFPKAGTKSAKRQSRIRALETIAEVQSFLLEVAWHNESLLLLQRNFWAK